MHFSFPSGSHGKESAGDAEEPVRSLGLKDPLEKDTATNSSILAQRIPWTEERGGLRGVTKTQTRLSN